MAKSIFLHECHVVAIVICFRFSVYTKQNRYHGKNRKKGDCRDMGQGLFEDALDHVADKGGGQTETEASDEIIPPSSHDDPAHPGKGVKNIAKESQPHDAESDGDADEHVVRFVFDADSPFFRDFFRIVLPEILVMPQPPQGEACPHDRMVLEHFEVGVPDFESCTLVYLAFHGIESETILDRQ